MGCGSVVIWLALGVIAEVVSAVDLERLLAVAAGARFTVKGRRDYANLLLLARLGCGGVRSRALVWTTSTGGPES